LPPAFLPENCGARDVQHAEQLGLRDPSCIQVRYHQVRESVGMGQAPVPRQRVSHQAPVQPCLQRYAPQFLGLPLRREPVNKPPAASHKRRVCSRLRIAHHHYQTRRQSGAVHKLLNFPAEPANGKPGQEKRQP
jgi:hypothetical protein